MATSNTRNITLSEFISSGLYLSNFYELQEWKSSLGGADEVGHHSHCSSAGCAGLGWHCSVSGHVWLLSPTSPTNIENTLDQQTQSKTLQSPLQTLMYVHPHTSWCPVSSSSSSSSSRPSHSSENKSSTGAFPVCRDTNKTQFWHWWENFMWNESEIEEYDVIGLSEWRFFSYRDWIPE